MRFVRSTQPSPAKADQQASEEKEAGLIVRDDRPRFLFFRKIRAKAGLTELNAKDSQTTEAGIVILFAVVLFSIGVVVFLAFQS